MDKSTEAEAQYGIVVTLMFTSFLYIRIKKYDDANQYARVAIDYANKDLQNDKADSQKILFFKALLYFIVEDFEESITTCDKVEKDTLKDLGQRQYFLC
jgi:hypothetical protein